MPIGGAERPAGRKPDPLGSPRNEHQADEERQQLHGDGQFSRWVVREWLPARRSGLCHPRRWARCAPSPPWGAAGAAGAAGRQGSYIWMDDATHPHSLRRTELAEASTEVVPATHPVSRRRGAPKP